MTRVFVSPRRTTPPASHSTATGTRELSRTPRRFSCPDIKLVLALGRPATLVGAFSGFVGNLFIRATQKTAGTAHDDDSRWPAPCPIAMLRRRREGVNGT